MPTATRWFIKTAFAWLVLSLAGGIATAVPDRVPAFIGARSPALVHALTVGWLTQLIFGVAYWMFPKYSVSAQRGHAAWPWLIYGPLNAGLILRIVAEPTHSPLVVASAILQMAAGLIFVIHAWPRVKGK